ncbi:MAG: sensor histidine kinase [Chitinophagaceae bacterium]
MLFFRFINSLNNQGNQPDKGLTTILNQRLAIAILFGIIFTHILRTVIIHFKLYPPIRKQKWPVIILTGILISYLYSLTNSAIVEWFELYNPSRKVSLQQRSLYNFLNDAPITFVWLSIYYVWHYVQINTKADFDKIRLESLVKDLELKTIKSHINPHFIFNALNSIRALVDENPTRARTAITELSNILRSSMQAEKSELVALEREIGIVKNYLALEHIRFEDRLNIVYKIDEDCLSFFVPPMMLQTLVENAIKHGISNQIQGGTITIIAKFVGDYFEMCVQNTGELINNESSNGFGISGTKSRLALLYGNKAFFNLSMPEPKLVEAKVTIPVNP